MSDENIKIMLIAFVLHSWWIIPVTWLIYTTIRDRFKEARENDEPASHVIGKAASGCLTMTIKAFVILLLLIIGVKACDTISGPSYGPEYEAWRR
jgi:hypothetical protein